MQPLLHSVPPALQQATAKSRLHWRHLDTHGHVLDSLLWGQVCTSFCLCPPKVCFPSAVKVLLALWWVNSNLLQEGLYHTQVYLTQSPCPCSSPLLILISSGDTQTQFCLTLCEVSGSCCAQDMFEPSKCLWWVWGLILDAISPLIPSCWGFSFAPFSL